MNRIACIKSFFVVCIGLLSTISNAQDISGWKTQGAAKWTMKSGVIQSDNKPGFLITPNSYQDFTITLDFWPGEDAIGGVFVRCADKEPVNKNNSYKVNIFDSNPQYGTGSIVNIAKASKKVSTVNKWNTVEITAKGKHLTVKLNNELLVDTTNDLYKSGPIALQCYEGLIKFRNIKIKSL